MSVLNKVRLVVYRLHETGVEIFLVKTNLTEDENFWRFPLSKSQVDALKASNDVIELDQMDNPQTDEVHGIAFEGDWHDIPSIRQIMMHDMQNVGTKVKEVKNELENGSFVTLKEAFKRVLPEEYKMLKELKEVLLEKNSIKYI